MPLTAERDTGEVLDTTILTDQEWSVIYKPKVNAGLRCRDCGGSVHAKTSSTGLRFFAHYVKPDSCASAGESLAHLTLKRLIAGLIRGCGAEATLEAFPGPSDSGGWRADVLGASADGRRIAFEVQLAGMTIAEGLERTDRYAQDGVAAVWVSTRHARWIASLPSVRLDLDGDHPIADRGLARLNGNSRWTGAGSVEFGRIVRGLLDGRIGAVALPFFFAEQVGEKTYFVDDPIVLASKQDITQYSAQVERERREDDRRELEEAQRAAHIRALYERQERVLQLALARAIEEGHESHRLWLGVPVTWWNGKLPVPLQEALGNEKTGRGAAIWQGESAKDVRLWAVVCPVANQVTPGLGASWSRRGVQVFVETQREADRIAKALGWTSPQLTILYSPS